MRAWWCDDRGNRFLLRGDAAGALVSFDSGLEAEPSWALLHEDRGRALLLANRPAQALAEFDRAACGSPCLAQSGDALMAMGRTSEAVTRYIQAKAVSKVASVAANLASAKHYDAALAIESSLLDNLPNDFADRSDLAAVYATIGRIEVAQASGGRKAGSEAAHRAIDAFAQATQLAPLNEDYLLSYAFAQMRWGDRLAARNAFERLLQIHPDQPDALAALARLKDGAASRR